MATKRSFMVGLLAIGSLLGGAVALVRLGAFSHDDLTEKVITGTPLWAYDVPCKDPDESVLQRAAVALEALKTFPSPREDEARRAVRFFGFGWTLGRLCSSDRLFEAVADAATAAGFFDERYLGEPSLWLAQQLGPRNPRIVEALARTAFSETAVPSDGLRWDLRPFARLVLGEFGRTTAPWSKRAFDEMSIRDPLTTSAALVAVGGGHPRARERTRALMNSLLGSVGNPIPYRTRNRLYDLSVALAMAGPAAEPYADPLIALLGRTVESWAPPFGMIDYRPVRMCNVALRIGGRVAAVARGQDYCRKTPKVYDQ